MKGGSKWESNGKVGQIIAKRGINPLEKEEKALWILLTQLSFYYIIGE